MKSVIYFDIRTKKEKLNEETLKTEMGLSDAYSTMEEKETGKTNAVELV